MQITFIGDVGSSKDCVIWLDRVDAFEESISSELSSTFSGSINSFFSNDNRILRLLIQIKNHVLLIKKTSNFFNKQYSVKF